MPCRISTFDEHGPPFVDMGACKHDSHAWMSSIAHLVVIMRLESEHDAWPQTLALDTARPWLHNGGYQEVIKCSFCFTCGRPCTVASHSLLSLCACQSHLVCPNACLLSASSTTYTHTHTEFTSGIFGCSIHN